MTGASDTDELSATVDERSGLDAAATPRADGIKVSVGAWGLLLAYPLVESERWVALDELEADMIRELTEDQR